MEVIKWISCQVTTLAEAFGETLTVERQDIYVGSLIDIPQDSLEVAFRRARLEKSFFPKIAELRGLAGVNSADEAKVEADAAWAYVSEYLRKWGADLLPIRSSGKEIPPPPLNARVDYALRRIGGLQALNQMDMNRMPFMYRDFCEAYAQAPLAEQMAPRLEQQFGADKVLATVKGLSSLKPMLPKKAPEER